MTGRPRKPKTDAREEEHDIEKPLVIGRIIATEQIEKLGEIVERIDNLVHAGAIPMRDALRVQALTEALPCLLADLKALYVEIAGEDPWADGG